MPFPPGNSPKQPLKPCCRAAVQQERSQRLMKERFDRYFNYIPKGYVPTAEDMLRDREAE